MVFARSAGLLVSLVAFSGHANAFVRPSLKSRLPPQGQWHQQQQSKTIRHDFLGGFDLAALESIDNQLIFKAGAAVLAATAAVAVGTFTVQGAKSPPKVSSAGAEEPEPEPIDVSIPYDAAARLAYDAWLTEGDRGGYDEAMFQKFKVVYQKLACAEVTVSRYQRELAALDTGKPAAVVSPPPAKVSLPPAKAVAVKEPKRAVAESVDLTIPYDAAAKLAYAASDKSMKYEVFKAKYEADAVADVIAKNAPVVDLSIPYDAAAKLAYESSDKSMAYPAFKKKFETDAVADVIAKKK